MLTASENGAITGDYLVPGPPGNLRTRYFDSLSLITVVAAEAITARLVDWDDGHRVWGPLLAMLEPEIDTWKKIG